MKSCKWCKPAAHIIGILVKLRTTSQTGTIGTFGNNKHLDCISYVSTENRNVTTAITQRNITNWNHWNKEYLDWISYISTGNRNVRADIKVWECYYIFCQHVRSVSSVDNKAQECDPYQQQDTGNGKCYYCQ